MMTSAAAPARISMHEFLYPRSVAVIGASESVEKFGGRVLAYLIKHGFQGRIAPINPGRETLRGLKSYPSIGAACAEGLVDVAILALPAAQVAAAGEECAAAGVRGTVVITAQFSELGGAGADREAELVAIARRTGMRLIGPNCLGIINPCNRMALSSSLSLELDSIRAGDIAIASQSGALMATMIVAAQDLGAGVSTCVSVGNQADTELCDFFEAFIADPNTRVICLYIEGLKSPSRFRSLARRAREAGKPVLAVKAGRSDAGIAAARSHTASLAGSYQAFRAVCEENGVVLVDEPEGMLQCAAVISRWGIPPARGVAVMSGSGGGGAIAVDRLSDAGLESGELGAQTRLALEGLVPATHNHLPIDLGVVRQTASAEGFEAMFTRVMADPSIGMGLYILTTQPTMTMMAEIVSRVGGQCGKPLLFVNVAGSAGEPVNAILRKLAYPHFRTVGEALRVMRAATDCIDRGPLPPAAEDIPPCATALQGTLTEVQAKALLAQAGVTMPRESLAQSLDEALAAARRIGYPVAMKLVSPDVPHKSDAGAVGLNIADDAALRECHAGLVATAARLQARVDGMLVAEMVPPGIEMLLGVQRDPQFGPMLVIGLGGVFVEVFRDVATLACPVSAESVLRALRRLRAWPLLNGARGRAPADLAALTDAAVNLSRLAYSLGARLIELEMNPITVHARGAVALDARGTLTGPAAPV